MSTWTAKTDNLSSRTDGALLAVLHKACQSA